MPRQLARMELHRRPSRTSRIQPGAALRLLERRRLGMYLCLVVALIAMRWLKVHSRQDLLLLGLVTRPLRLRRRSRRHHLLPLRRRSRRRHHLLPAKPTSLSQAIVLKPMSRRNHLLPSKPMSLSQTIVLKPTSLSQAFVVPPELRRRVSATIACLTQKPRALRRIQRTFQWTAGQVRTLGAICRSLTPSACLFLATREKLSSTFCRSAKI